jgi:transcriptional regulator with XRE-family HTH domain
MRLAGRSPPGRFPEIPVKGHGLAMAKPLSPESGLGAGKSVAKEKPAKKKVQNAAAAGQPPSPEGGLDVEKSAAKEKPAKKTDQNTAAVGKRIRTLRMEKELKVNDLAEITGLTASTISQVERGLISPSISTLKKICEALEITISSLFEGPESSPSSPAFIPAQETLPPLGLESILRAFPPVNLYGASPVVRKESRKVLLPGEGLRFNLLTPNLAGPIGFIYNEYEPGSNTGPGLYSHPGTECGLILSGELLVQIKGKKYLLKEGDSITFNSFDPHSKKNISDKVCTCVWVNVPPWF